MSNTPDGTTSGKVPAKPGILFVASTVLHPDKLDPLDFCDWYENTHIQEVQSTGGISNTQRYESLSFHSKYRQQDASKSTSSVPENRNFKYDFLTIYNMPDLAFRETKAFRGLDGQSKPNEQLLEKVFRQSEFLTEFCEEVEVEPPQADSTPAPFVVTVGGHYGSVATAAFSILSGYRRVKKYKIHEASVLSGFERSFPNEPKDLAVVDFSAALDTDELLNVLQGTDLKIGIWGLRRDYGGSERTPAKWKPK